MQKPGVEIRNGYFYVNGEKFFIKGVGYSPYRPHNKPVDTVSLELIEQDFERIKDAGFNTVRTWIPFNKQQLDLAKKYGLWVIQGTLANLEEAISLPSYLPKVVKMIKEEIDETKDSDNVLMYLFANELSVNKVHGAGTEQAENVLRQFKAEVDALELKRPISVANFPLLVILDDSMWDAVCYNVYAFNPYSVNFAMGFRGFLDWLKENRAKDKPLVITEYGVSVSPTLKGKEQNYGFGGNTEQEQAEGIITILNDIVASGAAGGCAFEWIDEWWKNHDEAQDEDFHDDDPEEWFGILKIESDYPQDTLGIPRPAYYALKEYNQAILIEPRNLCYYSDEVPVEVYCTDAVVSVECRINSGKWLSLKKEGKFWYNAMLSFKKDGEKAIEVVAKEEDGTEHRRTSKIWVYKRGRLDKQQDLKISVDKNVYKRWESIKIDTTLIDDQGMPVKDRLIRMGIFEPETWMEATLEKTADIQGKAYHRHASPRTGPLLIAVGADLEKDGHKRSFGDLTWVYVE